MLWSLALCLTTCPHCIAIADYSEYVVGSNGAMSTTPLPSPPVAFTKTGSSFATVNGLRAITLGFNVDATYAVCSARTPFIGRG
jgi:hypothetical protein